MSLTDAKMLQGLVDLSHIRATDKPLRGDEMEPQPIAGNRKERRAASAKARKIKKNSRKLN